MPTEFCRHIRPTGHRCGSPALRDQSLCFYHQHATEHHLLYPAAEAGFRAAISETPLVAEYYGLEPQPPLALNFPPLEDRASIQIAISMLLSAMAQNRIDPKRAGLLLYGLQVASANAKTLVYNTVTVRDVVTDEQGRELAPDEDPEDDPYAAPGKKFRGKGVVARLLEEVWDEDQPPLDDE